MKRSEVELTALHQEYETLGIWKRRLRWVGGEVIEAVGGLSALRLDPETERAARFAALVAAAPLRHGRARPQDWCPRYC
ncbi:MAG: hypothetical protein WA671_00500, partial [Candidatus Sulfotelmatobacter sp.]